jgi:hypothetical protein
MNELMVLCACHPLLVCFLSPTMRRTSRQKSDLNKRCIGDKMLKML